jgi:diketogulonate reductase-like aldo/keto reductase
MKKMRFLNRTMPKIGMGTWYMGEGKSPYVDELSSLRTGIEQGIQLIDTAEMYGEGLAEQLVGDAISHYSREQLTIVSKVYPWNATKDQMQISLENSLRRLKTDYLDLYLLHWREDVPLEQSVEALERLRDQGKIRSWGVSNYDVADIEELQLITNECATNQVLYHLGSRGVEFGLKPLMDELNMPLMAYSPLGHGEHAKHLFQQHPVILDIAKKYEVTIQQVLLAWVVAQEHVMAIPKASSSKHMKANLLAAQLTFEKEDLQKLNEAFPAPSKKVPLDEL